MKTRPEPVRGNGQLRWNAGGWFGSVFGGTAWIAVATFVEAAELRTVPWLLAAMFVASVALGVALWRKRHRLAPYPALLVLLGGLGVAATVVILHLRSTWGPEGISLWNLALFPGLMVLMTWVDRARRVSSAR